MSHTSRRRATLAMASAAALTLSAFTAAIDQAQAAPAAPGAGADVAADQHAIADIYYRALLLNTPFVESTWDPAAGTYRITDFYHVAVLGNAVLLKFGTYDPDVAGVSAATLRDHTLRTIGYAAAKNRWVDPVGGTWGRKVYWDSTMETYFVAAAKLMWSELDQTTRDNVDTIIRAAADDIVTAGAVSPSTNGLNGGYQGDSKIEEMGARSMPLATALAWLPDHPNAGGWREWHTRWIENMAGLPPADRANPAKVNGRSIAEWNQAHNVWDTFLVENHGAYSPIYEQQIGAYPGRNAAQFLMAGRPLPQELRDIASADQLWTVMGHTGTDAGVPQDFMVADRHHLYGRELLPVTQRATVMRDRYAARAEAMLAAHLIPYVQYPPTGRLTKFSGEPKYEPEARAELAMAYLLHRWSDRLGGVVPPVSSQEYFERFSTAVDYGAVPGLLVHQSPTALSASSTKSGYVKFAYHPQHDDWLFDATGASPAFLPSTKTIVQARNAHAYTALRDGFAGSATAIRTDTGVAGFTTLPDGSVVYASSGLAAGEGALRLYNLTMPGVPGLDGDRTFSWAGGSATLAQTDPATPRQVPGNWLNVDGRAGFVVRGGQNPIAVWPRGVTLSDGPATGSAGMVIEGHPAESPARTSERGAAAAPAVSRAGLVASLAGGHLSLFNLTAADIADAEVTVPRTGASITLYEGTQHVASGGATRYAVSPIAAADARVAPARFAATGVNGAPPPAGLTLTVTDSRTVSVTNAPGSGAAVVLLRSLDTGEVRTVRVSGGETVRADFAQGLRTPTSDLARGRTTFPTSPLPAGMTDPARAVDGNPATSWAPGAPTGRMVVDLGAVRRIGPPRPSWTSGDRPEVRIEVSDDGKTYTPLGADGGSGRYVAIVVSGWHAGRAGLAELAVPPAPAAPAAPGAPAASTE